MIEFLIFYFVFSAIFAVGVQAYDQDSIPLGEFIISIIFGWIMLPFGLGMAISKYLNG